MRILAQVPIKPVVRKDRSKEPSVEESGDSQRTSNLPVTTTEDQLLTLESRIQGFENGHAIDKGSASDNESTDREKMDSPVFIEQSTGNKSVFSALLKEQAGVSVSLESKNTVSGVQKLTHDEITKTVSLVLELQRDTPLLVERRDQVTFKLIGESPLSDLAGRFMPELEPDASEINTSAKRMQLPGTLEIDDGQSIVEEPEFVVPELIAKVVSMAAASWSSTGLKLNESTVMLLTNGMAYTSLTSPPGDITLPVDIAEADSGWTTWRQDDSGAIFLALRSGGERLLTGEEIDVTPLKNEDITGLHTKAHASTFGATMTTSWADISFNIDGTFEKASSVITTNGGAGTILTDMFSASFHQQTADGNSSVVGVKADMGGAGDSQTVNAGSDSQRPNKNLFGTYHLLDDGLTIEMRYANGDIERELLYRGGNFLFLGESSYRTQGTSTHYFDNLQKFALGLEKGKRVVWLSYLADAVMAAGRKSSSQITSSVSAAADKHGTAKSDGIL